MYLEFEVVYLVFIAIEFTKIIIKIWNESKAQQINWKKKYIFAQIESIILYYISIFLYFSIVARECFKHSLATLEKYTRYIGKNLAIYIGENLAIS